MVSASRGWNRPPPTTHIHTGTHMGTHMQIPHTNRPSHRYTHAHTGTLGGDRKGQERSCPCLPCPGAFPKRLWGLCAFHTSSLPGPGLGGVGLSPVLPTQFSPLPSGTSHFPVPWALEQALGKPHSCPATVSPNIGPLGVLHPASPGAAAHLGPGLVAECPHSCVQLCQGSHR